jgi:cysteine desulfurase
MIYLDYASTTPLHPEVLKTYTKLLESHYGNSDSLHDIGRKVNKAMEQSRDLCAKLLNVQPSELIFTSCASEANNYAVKGYALANQRKGKHIISTTVEHSSVMHSLSQLEEYFGFEITYIDVDEKGRLNMDQLKKALRSDTVLVSMMYVNNETGAIHQVDEVADYVHAHSRAAMHVDCVQAIGKIPVSFEKYDLASFSAHKIYGLKGSAMLYKKKNIELLPIISAGQQEQGIRGGTSNAPVNTMLAKTLRIALEEQPKAYQHVKKLNTMIRKALAEMETFVVNSPEDGSPFILNFSDMKIGSEIMLNALNTAGFAVSAQSTCASHSKAHSRVLAAMGLGMERATHAVRVSLSIYTTEADVEQFIKTLKEIHHDYATK